MDSQAIVDYIAQHLSQGHTEAAVRQHMMAYGWSQTAVDTAFGQYYQTAVPQLAELPVAKRRRWHIRHKWTARRYTKWGVVVVLVLAAVGAAWQIWPVRPSTPSAPKAVQLSYAQRQSSDVVTLGGAVANYTGAHGNLPTYLSVTPDDTMILCGGDGCNADTDAVGTLLTYNATDVHFAPYSPGLVAPDASTLYLVSGALCKDNNVIGEATDKPRSMVILYLRDNDDGSVTSRCVKL